jgi:hypothetical protein
MLFAKVPADVSPQKELVVVVVVVVAVAAGRNDYYSHFSKGNSMTIAKTRNPT